MVRLIKLTGKDGQDGLLVPIAHINAVETRRSEVHFPQVMIGGHQVPLTQEAARELAAIVHAYWAQLAGDADIACIDVEMKPRMLRAEPADRLSDGLGDRGA